jgi:hypothetical protein
VGGSSLGTVPTGSGGRRGRAAAAAPRRGGARPRQVPRRRATRHAGPAGDDGPGVDRGRLRRPHRTAGQVGPAVLGAELPRTAVVVEEHLGGDRAARVGDRDRDVLAALLPPGPRVQQHRRSEEDRVGEPGDQLPLIEPGTLAVGDGDHPEGLAEHPAGARAAGVPAPHRQRTGQEQPHAVEASHLLGGVVLPRVARHPRTAGTEAEPPGQVRPQRPWPAGTGRRPTGGR